MPRRPKKYLLLSLFIALIIPRIAVSEPNLKSDCYSKSELGDLAVYVETCETAFSDHETFQRAYKDCLAAPSKDLSLWQQPEYAIGGIVVSVGLGAALVLALK